MLAPFSGIPLIQHLTNRAMKIKHKNEIIILTSNHPSDDPLHAYATSIGHAVFRGALDNVFERFQRALALYPCDYFVRLCGDSPLIDIKLIEYLVEKCASDYLMISNSFVKTFPRGQGIEIAKASLFTSVDGALLSDTEKEHVFPYFYHHSDPRQCCSVKLKKNTSHLNQSVDCIDDLILLDHKKQLYSFNRSDIECITC